jgi:hypothetical protein
MHGLFKSRHPAGSTSSPSRGVISAMVGAAALRADTAARILLRQPVNAGSLAEAALMTGSCLAYVGAAVVLIEPRTHPPRGSSAAGKSRCSRPPRPFEARSSHPRLPQRHPGRFGGTRSCSRT